MTTLADEAPTEELLLYTGPDYVADFWALKAEGPYTIQAGAAISVTATAYDPMQGTLTFAWDLDGDGVFETPGQTATFSAQELAGPTTRTIAVQVTKQVTKGILKAVARTSVTITDAPSAP